MRGPPGLWDVASGRPVGEPLRHNGFRVRVARFRPDGKVLATGGDDGAVRLWDVASGRPIGLPMGMGHWVSNVRFSPDGSRLLVGRVEGVAALWDPATCRPVGGQFLAHPSQAAGHEVDSLAFTPRRPDGRDRLHRRLAHALGRGDGPPRGQG